MMEEVNTHQTVGVIGTEDQLGHAESNKTYGIKTIPHASHGKVYSKATLAETNQAFAAAWAKTNKGKK